MRTMDFILLHKFLIDYSTNLRVITGHMNKQKRSIGAKPSQKPPAFPMFLMLTTTFPDLSINTILPKVSSTEASPSLKDLATQ